MPESPRWLILKGRDDEAKEVMACLEECAIDDPEIELKAKEIRIAIDESRDFKVMDLFTQGRERNFHRTTLG